MCPADDTFLTASKDRTVRLWNVQQAGCIGQMDLPIDSEGDPHVVFDSTGMVFAVTVSMAGKQGNVSQILTIIELVSSEYKCLQHLI